MLVSAISSSSSDVVSKVRVNSRGGDSNVESALVSSNSISKEKKNDDGNNLFDTINEWKYFCHTQIEKGNFDVIV